MLIADSKFYSTEQLILNDPNATENDLPGQESNLNITYSPAPNAGQNTIDVYRHGKYPERERTSSRFQKQGGKVAYNILYADGHVATATDRVTAYRAIRQRFPG